MRQVTLAKERGFNNKFHDCTTWRSRASDAPAITDPMVCHPPLTPAPLLLVIFAVVVRGPHDPRNPEANLTTRNG